MDTNKVNLIGKHFLRFKQQNSGLCKLSLNLFNWVQIGDFLTLDILKNQLTVLEKKSNVFFFKASCSKLLQHLLSPTETGLQVISSLLDWQFGQATLSKIMNGLQSHTCRDGEFKRQISNLLSSSGLSFATFSLFAFTQATQASNHIDSTCQQRFHIIPFLEGVEKSKRLNDSLLDKGHALGVCLALHSNFKRLSWVAFEVSETLLQKQSFAIAVLV